MDNFKTPIKNKVRNNVVQIPPSPLMKKIGFGTHVVVYEFQRSPLPEKLRSPWAIKKLIEGHKQQASAKTAKKRLKAEAEILRKLDHPNIVGFRACTKQSDDTCILAMEGCTSSLGDLIENRLDYLGDAPFPANTILKMTSDIANALDYLHNKMLLLHGDIKSMNILVKEEFVVCKLCDFGVCLPLTKTGELDKDKAGDDAEYAGTPHWCAPEVYQSDQIITSKADVYSFGLVIWEMLSLVPPNMSESFEESDISISENNIELRQRPPLPDVELGPEYNLVLEIYFCCTAVDMTKRANAKDLVNVFNEVIDLDKK